MLKVSRKSIHSRFFPLESMPTGGKRGLPRWHARLVARHARPTRRGYGWREIDAVQPFCPRLPKLFPRLPKFCPRLPKFFPRLPKFFPCLENNFSCLENFFSGFGNNFSSVGDFLANNARRMGGHGGGSGGLPLRLGGQPYIIKKEVLYHIKEA